LVYEDGQRGHRPWADAPPPRFPFGLRRLDVESPLAMLGDSEAGPPPSYRAAPPAGRGFAWSCPTRLPAGARGPVLTPPAPGFSIEVGMVPLPCHSFAYWPAPVSLGRARIGPRRWRALPGGERTGVQTVPLKWGAAPVFCLFPRPWAWTTKVFVGASRQVPSREESAL